MDLESVNKTLSVCLSFCLSVCLPFTNSLEMHVFWIENMHSFENGHASHHKCFNMTQISSFFLGRSPTFTNFNNSFA